MHFRILLTHTPQSRRQYYGERALRGLQRLGEVSLHEADDALDVAGLVRAARDADVIVADRLTAGPAEVFAQLPKLRAFVRCAVDIRNVDVEAASAAGVLVTRAGPGFTQSVAELALGFMIDLSRGISRATAGLSCRACARRHDGTATVGLERRHHRLRQHRAISREHRSAARNDGAGHRSVRQGRRVRISGTCRSTNCCGGPTT